MKSVAKRPSIVRHSSHSNRAVRSLKLAGFGLFFVLIITGVISYTRGSEHTRVQAATASTINFQGRLKSASGNLVADGTYSMEFKLYTAAIAGSNEWTETQGTVTVKNGFFSVALGSSTAFPGTIDWSQEKWLTLNVAGDGEMSPRIKLTAVPYAFRAGQADALTNGSGTLSSSDIVQISPAALQTANSANAGIRINQTGAGGLIQMQGDGSDVFTVSKAGSAFFAGTVGIGTAATAESLTLNGGLVLGTTAGTTAGTIRFDGSDFQGYNGSGWISLTGNGVTNPIINKTKTANESVISTTAFQDDDELFFPIGANETWNFRFAVQAISGATPDIKFDVTAPAGATCTVAVADAEGAVTVAGLGCGVTSGLIAGNGVNDFYEITGTVANGANAGNVRLRWAQNTSNATNTTVLSGSYVEAQRSVGSGVAQAFIQNGNSFGATAELGTNDTNALSIITDGVERINVSSGGLVKVGGGGAATTALDVAGLTLNTDADGAVGVQRNSFTVTKNDANVRTFSGYSLVADLNAGVGNANTTLNLMNIDTTNTSTTGLTTNLLRLGYGGSDRFVVDSAGIATIGGSATINATSGTALTIASVGSADLNLTAGSGKVGLGATEVEASGSVAFDLNNAANTTLTLENAGAGISNLNISDGALQIAGVSVITNSGALQNVTADAGIITSGILGAARGGTGLDTSGATNGQLLIGNGAGFSLGTIADGGGTTITPGAGTLSISVNYGSSSTSAVRGDTSLTCASGTGNLSGGGNTITLGSGGSCNNIVISDSPSFATSVTTPLLTSTAGLSITSTNDVTIDSGSNTLVIGATDTTLQRNAAGSYTIDLNDAAATTLVLNNSGTGAASLNLNDGALLVAGSSVITNSAGLQNITGYAQTAGNFSQTGTGTFSTGSGAVSLNGATTIATSTSSATALTVNGTTGTAATALNIVQTGNAANLVLSNTARTSGALISMTHSTSAFTGTGIAFNFASGSGSFASGKFLDFQINGATRVQFDNTGALQINSDSATALQIRNAAGSTNLFTVDSSGGLVQIGSSTGDATGVLFVLDSKTGTDPTGVNGASYYNATDNRARCYENGVWSDCTSNRILGETTLGAANGTIDVTLAASTEEMVCRISVKGRSVNNGIYVRFNNDAGGANYGWNEYDIINATVGDAQDASDSEIQLTGTDTSNFPATAELRISNFGDTRKVVDWSYSGAPTIGTNLRRYSGTGQWANTANQITSVQFITSTGTFNAGSHAWCQGRDVR